jgi:HK97 family phage prohead protease
MTDELPQTKAWSTLQIKGIHEDSRRLIGIASTPATDRAGDIVEPAGAKFTLPLPLLSQHDHASPIGQVVSAKITKAGIEIEADIPKDTGLDYVETAWKQIKAGLVRGLSIGFRPLEAEKIKNGFRFTSWSWHELSAVTIPCNHEANILAVKHFDAKPIPADDIGGQMAKAEALAEIKKRAAAALEQSISSLSR